MRNRGLLDWDEHVAWFERKEAAGEAPWVFEIDSIPLGFVQFDKTDCPDTVEWGFYVAPDATKGTGQRLGIAAISYIFKREVINQVIGQVTPDNLRSQRFHERLGFHRMSSVASQESSSATPLISFSLSRSEWPGMNTGRHGETHECHC